MLRPERPFSCWTYAYVNRETFEEHLEALLAYGRGTGGPPEIIGLAQVEDVNIRVQRE